MVFFNENTPTEIHNIKGRSIFVKREDLYGRYPAPPLGKLRGLRVLVDKYYQENFKVIGCWDTRVSKLGQGLSALATCYPDLKTIISYPIKKGKKIPEPIIIAKQLGSEIYPIRGNHVSICYSQVKKYIESRNGVILPFGLECEESVRSIANEARLIPKHQIKNGTLVLSCGSGVTLAGILVGLEYEPKKIVGISSGRSIQLILKCIEKYVETIPKSLSLYEPIMPYYEKSACTCPFPAHPNYDLKAWEFLISNLDHYDDPIFFWNVGS